MLGSDYLTRNPDGSSITTGAALAERLAFVVVHEVSHIRTYATGQFTLTATPGETFEACIPRARDNEGAARRQELEFMRDIERPAAEVGGTYTWASPTRLHPGAFTGPNPTLTEWFNSLEPASQADPHYVTAVLGTVIGQTQGSGSSTSYIQDWQTYCTGARATTGPSYPGTQTVVGEGSTFRLLDGSTGTVFQLSDGTRLTVTQQNGSTQVAQHHASGGLIFSSQQTLFDDGSVQRDFTRPNGVREQVSLDTTGQPTSLLITTPTGNNTQTVQNYTYNSAGQRTLQSTTTLQAFENGRAQETTTTPSGVTTVRSYDAPQDGADAVLAGTITTTPDGAGDMNRVVTLSVNGQALELIQTASAADLANGLQDGDYHTTQVNINGEPALNQALIARSIDDNYPSASDIIDHRASQGLANTVAAGDDANFFGTTASLVQVTGRVDWWNAPEVVRTAGSVSDIISLISALRSHRPLAIATAGANFLSHNSSNPEIAQLAAGFSGIGSLALWQMDLSDPEQRGSQNDTEFAMHSIAACAIFHWTGGLNDQHYRVQNDDTWRKAA